MTGRRELKLDEKKKTNNNFWDAVIFAKMTDQYNQPNFYPTHLRLTKTDYFIHRYLGEDPQQRYSEYTFGPYSPKSTYAGGEMLALKKNYIKKIKGGFIPGNNIQETKKYTRDNDSITKVVNFLRYKKDDDLELLATTDFIIYKLLAQKNKPTAALILNYIKNSSAWSQKISRLSLDEDKIKNVMQVLRDFAKINLPYPTI